MMCLALAWLHLVSLRVVSALTPKTVDRFNSGSPRSAGV